MSSCRMRRKRLIRPTRARKIDKLRLPHRPDKLAHRATYTCHVSFQLTHRQQLVGTACVIIDAADHLHLHFKTPCAGNHVAHCRNGIDVTAFQNPDITRKVGSACSTGPRLAGFLRLNENAIVTALDFAARGFHQLQTPHWRNRICRIARIQRRDCAIGSNSDFRPSGTAIGPASPTTGCP